ncbi:MAG: cation transporter [Kiloniellales bacterium]
MAAPVDCGCDAAPAMHPRYRRVLWLVLAINAAMFGVEVVFGLIAGSLSLQADALDFLGDALNYGISLAVLGSAVHWRAATSWLKGAAMAVFGAGVLAAAIYRVFVIGVPDALIMGTIGGLALAANLACAMLLFKFRRGDSNMRSVWLCSRNDTIGNIAVILAALGVAVTGAGWADLGVAAVIASLAVAGGVSVMRQAQAELRAAYGASALSVQAVPAPAPTRPP